MRSSRCASAAAALAALLLAACGGGEGGGTCQRQLVPAYFAPGAAGGWDALIEQAPSGRASVILNPASGPGPARDPRYAELVARAHAKDLAVLGYVHTRFASRPPAEVDADIGRYRDWYGVDGVFLDEAAASAAELPYYRALAGRARARGAGTVVLNPGRVPDEGYAGVADVIVTFEGTRAAYATATFPAWTTRHDAARFAHLVYAAGGAPPGAVEALAADRHAANVYVTDDAGANPWDALAATYAAASARIARCADRA